MKRWILLLVSAVSVVVLVALAADPASAWQGRPGPQAAFQGPGGWGGPGMGPGRRQYWGPEVGPGFRGRFGPRGYFGRPGWGRGRFGRMGAPRFFPGRLRQELGLTDDQLNRLRQMAEQRRKEAIQTRAQLETRQLELQELLRAEQPDRAAIDRKIQEIANLRAAQMKAGIEQRLAFQSVLTPEQRQKLKNLRREGFGPGEGPTGPRRQFGPMREGPARPPAPDRAPSPPQL